MVSDYLNRARKKINEFCCYLIRKNPQNIFFNENIAYLTVFHDYESNYAGNGLSEPSHKGITRILDIESEYGIKATYNIVGKLMYDEPKIISRIISDKHEIASHSYKHDIMTTLSTKQIHNNIIKTKEIFNSFDIKIKGFRSPQSKWNFRLMHVLLNQGLQWSAENDKASFPYILKRDNNKLLVRMPIAMDDWDYQAKGLDPEIMYSGLMSKVNNIAQGKKYGAIGFHPWVQGVDNRRLEVFERFVREIAKRNDIIIITFGQMHKLLLNTMH